MPPAKRLSSNLPVLYEAVPAPGDIDRRGEREVIDTSSGHGPPSRPWSLRQRHVAIAEPHQHLMVAALRALETDSVSVGKRIDVPVELPGFLDAEELGFEVGELHDMHSSICVIGAAAMRLTHFMLVALGASLIACSSDEEQAKDGPWECIQWTSGITEGSCNCRESTDSIRADYPDETVDISGCTGQCCSVFRISNNDGVDSCECRPRPCPEDTDRETVPDCNTSPF